LIHSPEALISLCLPALGDVFHDPHDRKARLGGPRDQNP
jgi:hypothetical protein